MTKTVPKKTSDLEQLDSVSKRLKYIVDTMGVKQSHMADKLGVSPSGLHYILNNDVKFSKNAKKIAEYLNVSKEWLTTGVGDIYEENTSIKTYKIPIYYPDQLKLSYRSAQSSSIKSNDFFLTPTAYPNKMLAIYMTDTNFVPKFEVGDIIAFEQCDKFSEGEILLVYLAKTHSIVIKYGFHLGKNIILISYDEAPMQLESENGDVVVGVYRECLKRSRVI